MLFPFGRRNAGRQGDSGRLPAGVHQLVAGRLDKGLEVCGHIIAQRGEGFPLLSFGNAHGIAQRGDLRRVHQPGVIILVARERQAITLDGVGNEHGWHIVIRLLEGFQQGFDAMPAKVGHQRGQFRIAEAVNQLKRLLPARQIAMQAFAPGSTPLISQRGIFGIGALVDPVRYHLPAGLRKHFALALAMFQRQHPPAAGFENVVKAAEHAVSCRAVQRLTVVIDNPPAIADAMLETFDQAFIDIAFVQFGIAHQRDHAPGLRLSQLAVSDEVILHQAGECRDRHPQTHRSGGEIDRNAVLGARGVTLRPAHAAKPFQRFAALRAQQIVNGVQHRPGMRLDGHLVLRAQRVKIERGHDRADRGATGLVPADLQAVAALAQVIGIVNNPRGKPAQPGIKRFDLAHQIGARVQRGRVRHRILHDHRQDSAAEVECPCKPWREIDMIRHTLP